ncbi:CpsD/CapB family tyrosine-protein kinase [Paenibacillus sp. MBLB4367]|uniref:CpsD/CapB family tyrosine-protein kinase n=1 Tax=Paenibacillus sp. MBLB4367 TaxID=3384767 RepID=UPI0039084096
MRASTVRNKLLPDLHGKCPVPEQFRTLRTNIQFSTIDDEAKSIAITSAQSGEGKTITAANLAIAYAMEEKNVLLIDGDLRKPSIHRLFACSNRIGLSNVLVNQNTLEEAITQTHGTGVSILPSGPTPPNPAELLGSKRMTALMERVYSQFDIILVDTPSTLAVTDSQILAAKCDGVLLVFSSGKLKRDNAKKAIDRLKFVNARIIGSVLNNSAYARNESSSYYLNG